LPRSRNLRNKGHANNTGFTVLQKNCYLVSASFKDPMLKFETLVWEGAFKGLEFSFSISIISQAHHEPCTNSVCSLICEFLQTDMTIMTHHFRKYTRTPTVILCHVIKHTCMCQTIKTAAASYKHSYNWPILVQNTCCT